MAKTPEDIASSKNIIINGAFDFWQRVAGNTTTVNTSTNQNAYAADRSDYQSSGATTKNYSIVRSSNIPTFTQSGFESTYSYLFTMITGIASPVAADYVLPIGTRIEGLDYAKIHGQTVTYSFWFNASLTGTYSVAFRSSAANRSYVTTFTQNNANTWEFKSITLILDTTGAYNFDNTLGLEIELAGYGGSSITTSTLNTWQTGTFAVASTATNYQATSGATIRVAQVSLVLGLGIGTYGFTRSGSIADELLKCQRYYEKSYDVFVAPGTVTSTNTTFMIPVIDTGGSFNTTRTFAGSGGAFKATKRALPTVTFYNPLTGTSGFVNLYNGGAVDTVSVSSISNFSTNHVGTQITLSGSAAATYTAHFTAEAEL